MSDSRFSARVEELRRARQHLTLDPKELRAVRTLRIGLVLVLALLVTACGDQKESPDKSGEGQSISAALPKPDAGYKWVSWRNVAAQVPEAWGHSGEPDSAWCIGWDHSTEPHDRPPYVDVGTELGGTPAIGCPPAGRPHDEAFGEAPDFLWATHLKMDRSEGEPDRTLREDGWTLVTRTIGQVRVQLLSDEEHQDEAARILESLRKFTTDQNGCDASSPVQATEFVRPPNPFDVTRLPAADSISICQYARGIPIDQPALMASRRVRGPEADRLLEGLAEAPPGRGPEAPNSCVHDRFGDTGVVIRINREPSYSDIFMYYDWCFGSGTDDGTVKRQLTALTCAPLFERPVVAWGYSSIAMKVCDADLD